MGNQKTYRACFFTNSQEEKREIKRIKADFENVVTENFPVSTKYSGIVSITVVHFSSPKDSDLFSDEEWEMIYGSKQ